MTDKLSPEMIERDAKVLHLLINRLGWGPMSRTRTLNWIEDMREEVGPDPIKARAGEFIGATAQRAHRIGKKFIHNDRLYSTTKDPTGIIWSEETP